mmetsp:Transcript_8767/g.20986  ORF Transcript_8767/g.20986 Transcript_8767/m.20986 type:complete len:227 (+) Transcript_8767:642-1322(+)
MKQQLLMNLATVSLVQCSTICAQPIQDVPMRSQPAQMHMLNVPISKQDVLLPINAPMEATLMKKRYGRRARRSLTPNTMAKRSRATSEKTIVTDLTVSLMMMNRRGAMPLHTSQRMTHTIMTAGNVELPAKQTNESKVNGPPAEIQNRRNLETRTSQGAIMTMKPMPIRMANPSTPKTGQRQILTTVGSMMPSRNGPTAKRTSQKKLDVPDSMDVAPEGGVALILI